MGKRKDCDATCICSCCAKNGDRKDCPCTCNKCDCAKRRLQLKISGITRKNKENKPPTHCNFIHEDAASISQKLHTSKTSHVTSKPPINKKDIKHSTAKEDESGKRAEEMMYHFCYNEDLSTSTIVKKLQPRNASIEKESLDDRKGLYMLWRAIVLIVL